MSENFFVAFHNMRGNEIMKLSAETPGGLIRKMIENNEAIESLSYDHHTTNLKNFLENESDSDEW